MCFAQAELEKAEQLAASKAAADASQTSEDGLLSSNKPQRETEEPEALEGLRQQLQDSELERAALSAEVEALRASASSPVREMVSPGGGDLVSMAVLEDFREQQMEERSEWEAEKALLEEELARLRAGGGPGVSVSAVAATVVARDPPPEVRRTYTELVRVYPRCLLVLPFGIPRSG